MLAWNPDQYLRFAEERTRPCHDLTARIAVDAPQRIIDLGCGPGNSTQVLAGRWPDAELTGLDSSEEMIAAARRNWPDRSWIHKDIAQWATEDQPKHNVIFSNAALQWVPGHSAIFPKLMKRVAPGGALAVQVPNNIEAPAHRVARELAGSPQWRDRLPPGGVREWHAHAAPFYYDLLAPPAARVDFWETEYLHVMEGPEAIVEWYKGTGLRPYLAALRSDAEQEQFVAEYLAALRGECPPRADGRVLFPFRRLFLIAYAKVD